MHYIKWPLKAEDANVDSDWNVCSPFGSNISFSHKNFEQPDLFLGRQTPENKVTLAEFEYDWNGLITKESVVRFSTQDRLGYKTTIYDSF